MAPCDYKRDYPENWKEIVAEKKRKHNNKCELCYAPNNAHLYRYDKRFNTPWSWDKTRFLVERIPAGDLTGAEERMSHIEGKPVKIVLTVHHIDGDKTNNTDANLLLSCQRCHLRLDKEKHMKKRRKSK